MSNPKVMFNGFKITKLKFNASALYEVDFTVTYFLYSLTERLKILVYTIVRFFGNIETSRNESIKKRTFVALSFANNRL